MQRRSKLSESMTAASGYSGQLPGISQRGKGRVNCKHYAAALSSDLRNKNTLRMGQTGPACAITLVLLQCKKNQHTSGCQLVC